MQEIDLNKIDLTEEKRQAKLLPERASLLSIHSEATLNRVNEFVKEVKRRQKDVDNKLDPILDLVKGTKKALDNLKKETKAGLIRAEEIAKAEIARYLTKLRDERLEAERKAAEEAEERFRKARELEMEGKAKEAEALREADTAVVPVPKEIKLAGTHLKETWEFEIEDESKIPRDFLMIDRVKIGKTVRTFKDKTNIPGVMVFPKTGVSTRIKE